MKKFLVIGLALTSIAFAKGNFDNNNNDFGGKGQGQGQGKDMSMKEMQVSTLTEAQQKELATLMETHKKASAPLMISLKEKDLGIEKELLADKPNWTKIEALTKEKAAIEAQLEVQMLKNRVEVKEKFGIEVGFGHGMKGQGKGFKK